MINYKNSQPSASGRNAPSLSALEGEHSRLLEMYQVRGDTSTFFDDVVDFVHEGQKAGATLYLPDDRQTLQGMLDYWAIILHREYGDAPDTTLQEIDPSKLALRDDQCPYKGIEPFSQSDQEQFFRRDALINEMYDKLQQSRLLLLIGPSGIGTTSAVVAGLLPRLVAEATTTGNHTVRIIQLQPGANPLQNLARKICSASVHSGDQALWVQTQVKRLHQENCLPQLLKETGDRPVILFVDQFEELFTLCVDDSIRQAFVNNLVAVLTTPTPIHRVILSLRLEFKDYLDSLPIPKPLIEQGLFRVKAMTEEELRTAILQPAASIGLHIQPAVVEQLILDVLHEPASLPLLQFALRKLWDLREYNWITLNSYQRLGSVKHALVATAETVYGGLTPAEKTTAKEIFLNLAYTGEELAVTNQRLSLQELRGGSKHPELVDGVIQKLADARLLRVTREEEAADPQTAANPRVEIVHEVLVNSWPRLRGWLEESWEERRQRQRFTDKAREWDASGRKEDLLLQGTYLDDALQREKNGEHFTLLENQYLAASRDARADAQKKELQRSRKLNYTLVALLICVAIIALLSTLYFRQLLKQTKLEKYNLEAIAAIEHGNFVQAVEKYDHAVDRDPNNPKWHFERANAYVLQGNEYMKQGDDKADEAYTYAFADYTVAITQTYEPLAEVLYSRGHVSLILDQNEQAIADFTQAVKIDPKYVDAHRELGLAFVRVGEYISATASYGAAIALAPSDVEAYLARGAIQIEQGLYDGALADFTQVITLEHGNANAFLGLARIYTTQNDPEIALINAIRSVELAPANGEITKTVIALLDGFVQSTPDSVSMVLGRARVYVTLRKYEQAFTDIDRAIRLKADSLTYSQIFDLCTAILNQESDNQQARMLRAAVAEKLNDYGQAIEDYSQVIKVDQTNLQAYLRRGLAYMIMLQYPDAIADFTIVLDQERYNTSAFYQRGLAYAARQDQDNAIKDFTAAIASDPVSSDAYFQRGVAYMVRQRYTDAIQDFSAVIEREPNNWSAYFNRGLAHMNQANYQDAIADYEAVVAADRETQQFYDRIRNSYFSGLNQILSSALGLPQTRSLDYLNIGLAYIHLELAYAKLESPGSTVAVPSREIPISAEAALDAQNLLFAGMVNSKPIELNESQFNSLLNDTIKISNAATNITNNPVELIRVWFEPNQILARLELKDYAFTLDLSGRLLIRDNHFQIEIQNAAAGAFSIPPEILPIVSYQFTLWINSLTNVYLSPQPNGNVAPALNLNITLERLDTDVLMISLVPR